MEIRITSPRIARTRKSSSKAIQQPPKKEIEDEWETKVLCTLEKEL